MCLKKARNFTIPNLFFSAIYLFPTCYFDSVDLGFKSTKGRLLFSNPCPHLTNTFIFGWTRIFQTCITMVLRAQLSSPFASLLLCLLLIATLWCGVLVHTLQNAVSIWANNHTCWSINGTQQKKQFKNIKTFIQISTIPTVHGSIWFFNLQR